MRSLLILFLCFGLFTPSVSAYPRHVDPSIAEETLPDPEVLFNLYYLMFQGIVSGDFDVSEEWLMWAQEQSDQTEFFSLLEEYNGLIDIEITNLNLTMFYFDQVFIELNNLRLDLAEDSYHLGVEYLSISNDTLPLILSGTDQIGGELGYYPENVYDVLSSLEEMIDGYEELAGIIDKVLEGESPSLAEMDLIELYMADLFPDYEDYPGFNEYLKAMIQNPVYPFSLIPTTVIVAVNSSEVYVGDSLVLSGRLTGVTGGKTVQVFFNGIPNVVVETNSDGEFEYVFKAVHRGSDKLNIYVVYWPSGNDVQVYLPSQSDSVSVSLLYHTPEIVFSHASIAFPGLSFAVDGSVSYMDEGLEGVPVSVDLLGAVTSTETDSEGDFLIETVVNPDGVSGNHSLVVSTQWLGSFEPVSKISPVEVERLRSSILVKPPLWALSGSVVRISGGVTSDVGALDGCSVDVYWVGGAVSTLTESGEFSVVVPVDLLSFSSNIEFRVEAEPLESFIDPVSVSFETRVFNSFSLLAVLGAVASGVYLYRRRVSVLPVVEPEIIVVVPSSGSNELEEDSPSSMYNQSLGLVSRKSGVTPHESQTIREYLREIQFKVDSYLFKVFEELSMRYERWLYDRPKPVDLDIFRRLWKRIIGDEPEE